MFGFGKEKAMDRLLGLIIDAEKETPEMVKEARKLIEKHCAKIGPQDRANNLLIDALSYRREGVARLLIAHGANVNVRTAMAKGAAPLHLAAEAGNLDMVKLLIEKGAEVNVRNDSDEAPLHLAAANGFTEVARLLLEHGAFTHVRDAAKRSPLQAAALRGSADIYPLLIEHGATLDADVQVPLSARDAIETLQEQRAAVTAKEAQKETEEKKADRQMRAALKKRSRFAPRPDNLDRAR